MALTTPILYSVPAFDAADAHTFTFVVQGGNQVVANRLIIKNNETLDEVYNQQITSFGFDHIVPADTLENGVYYQATITTYDASGEASTPSAPIQFYCYTTPTLVLSNLPSGNIIANSAFTFEATYSQAEGELLNSYTFTLYDAQNIQIATSGVKYVGSTTAPPTILSYTFAGLTDNTAYYIQATGQTIAGTQVESSKVLVSVKYTKPEASMLIALTNNCQEGYITVQSNFVAIDGVSNPADPIYVDDNTAVDTRADGDYVRFDSGYAVNGDFTMGLWGYDLNENADIFEFSDTDCCHVVVAYRQDFEQDGKVYADCLVTSNDIIYYIYTPSITAPASSDKLQIWLRRIMNLYTIELHEIDE